MTALPGLDRRRFLIASVGATAGNLLQARPLNALQEPPSLLVCERRLRGALDSAGAEVIYIDGDVTALWRDRLDGLWRSGGARVEGLTLPASLFCLEQLARGRGHRVTHRLEVHGGNAVRWIIAPVSTRGVS